MPKHGRGRAGSQARWEKPVTVQAPMPTSGVRCETRDAFHETCIRTGEGAAGDDGSGSRARILHEAGGL